VKRKISLVCSGCFLETVVKESELGWNYIMHAVYIFK
jgi:hypothetical protein